MFHCIAGSIGVAFQHMTNNPDQENVILLLTRPLGGNERFCLKIKHLLYSCEILDNPIQRKDIPFRQILASIGQSRLMNIYQQLFGAYNVTVSQALLTRKDIDDRVGYLNIRDTLLGLIDHNVVPIINENDVVNTEELGEVIFGDNDTLSALVSNLIDADALILLSDIDGLYTADPINNKDAKLN